MVGDLNIYLNIFWAKRFSPRSIRFLWVYAMADIVIILKRIKVQDTVVNLKTPKNNIKENIF